MIFAAKVFLSSIELTAMIILSLTIFRFQYIYYLHKIYGIAVLMSIISFYFRDIISLPLFAIVSELTTEIILIMIVYRLPFFYSLLLSITGFLAVTVIEALVFWIGSQLHLMTEESIQESALVLGYLEVAVTAITMLVIYFLQKRKIGFLFRSKHLASNTALKGYNFLLSAVLVCSVVFIQIELISITEKSVNHFFIIFMALIFLIGIFVAYKHNKSIIREKYERPVKNELDRSIRNENG